MNKAVGMTNDSERYARPALWGFFICIAVAAVLLIVRLFIPSFIQYHWDAERAAEHTRAEQVIHEAFRN